MSLAYKGHCILFFDIIVKNSPEHSIIPRTPNRDEKICQKRQHPVFFSKIIKPRLSSTKKTLWTLNFQGGLKQFCSRSNLLLKNYQGSEPMPIEALALSGDGLLLFTSDGMDIIHIYSIPSQKLLQTVETPHENMMALTVSPNNQNLVTSDHEGLLILWKIERDQFSEFKTIKPRKKEVSAHETNISAILITNNNKFLCTADEGGTVKIWEFPYLGKQNFFQPKIDLNYFFLSKFGIDNWNLFFLNSYQNLEKKKYLWKAI